MREFVLQYLWNRFEAAVGDFLVEIGEGTDELALDVELHGFGQDRVVIVVIMIIMYLVLWMEVCGNRPD